ncbi:hypothetical protein [Azospirillum sp. TSO22-1]|uniref:hypothetical protein n=1 Tax=Azospirillum sp. TSO22-1 TaxID=716789 RepID=UPI000D603A67|nr:hypothetical protein [Azospirillum sp. TSO22-1]PWC55112.1 hypothetical protein TSO221_05695 [Azospirillum sp. TSO22-1]
MKPARSQTTRPASRTQRALAQMAPAISSILMGMACVGGGAGLVASFLEQNGVGLALSATLLVVAAELYFSSRPREA